MGRRIDLKGRQFERLYVEQYAGNKRGPAVWRCVCECGNVKVISGDALRRGLTRSCGCLHKETAAAMKNNLQHGHSLRNNRSRTYRIWCNMKTRCNNPNYKQRKDYGGRGIKVCDRWNTFANFLADMGEAPPKLCIDRIDNDGDYEPGNCQWVTHKENNFRNKRQPKI